MTPHPISHHKPTLRTLYQTQSHGAEFRGRLSLPNLLGVCSNLPWNQSRLELSIKQAYLPPFHSPQNCWQRRSFSSRRSSRVCGPSIAQQLSRLCSWQCVSHPRCNRTPLLALSTLLWQCSRQVSLKCSQRGQWSHRYFCAEVALIHCVLSQ